MEDEKESKEFEQFSEYQTVEQYGSVTISKSIRSAIPLYKVDIEEDETYGRLSPLLRDERLEEIMYNSLSNSIKVYHRVHGMCDTNVRLDAEDIYKIIKNIASQAGKSVDAKNPILDARLPDGSRVNATLPPVSPDGPTLTIRKFFKDPLTIIDLITNGTINSEAASFLWMCIDGLRGKPANIIISGGTSSGKTTTLNVLASFIPEDERLVSIEDTTELQLKHEHWVRLESVPPSVDAKEITMDMLLKNALRMRPTRIIVGEVRGREAETLFAAMNVGNDGCLGTLHSNSALETITRLTNPPMSVPPSMLNALDLIVMQQRIPLRGKFVRRITEITEIAGMEGEKPRLNTIYSWNASQGKLVHLGLPSKLREKICKASNISLQEFDAIMHYRQRILEKLISEGKRDMNSIADVIQGHYFRARDVQDLVRMSMAQVRLEE